MAKVAVETGLNSVRPKELFEILKSFFKFGAPKPIVLGSPGTGKTSIVYKLAKDLKIPHYTFQATLYDPVEIKGLPVYDHDKNVARFLPFEDMPTQGEGILVIDDLPHAPTQTQNAFMRLVLEGVAGAWNLGKLFPIATGNRAIDRAGAKDLQTAMANRFCFLNLEVNNEDWREWAIDAGLAPQVVGYLGTPMGKEWLDRFDAGHQINPTPRSWEFVSHIIKSMGVTSTSKIAMYGCVGEEATLKFTGWLKYYEKMPDLQKIVAGKDIYPDEMDVMYATIAGLVSITKEFPKKKAIAQRMIDYAVHMPDNFVELSALMSKDLLGVIGYDIMMSSNLDEWVEKFPDLIRSE